MIFMVVIAICIAIYLLYKTFCGSKQETYQTSKSELDAMGEIISIMDRYLKKYNIDYFLLAGTLIGGLRNKPPGILYWDDDIDVAIFDKDTQKLEQMLHDSSFLKQVDVAKTLFGYQFYPKNHRKFNKGKKEFIYDIFIFTKQKDNQYRMINNEFPQSIIPTLGHVFPIQHKPFWKFILPYPNKGLEMLKIQFGDNILDQVQYYNHSNFSKPESYPVTKETTTPLHLKVL